MKRGRPGRWLGLRLAPLIRVPGSTQEHNIRACGLWAEGGAGEQTVTLCPRMVAQRNFKAPTDEG